MDDLYALIGLGAISASSFIWKLKDENKSKDEKVIEENTNKIIEENIFKAKRKTADNTVGITVKGVDNIMIRFAKCCNPVPGDDIMGYITKGRGVSVHRADCGNLKSLIMEDGAKVVDVSWGSSNGRAYIAEIQVKAEDIGELLTDIMGVISELNLQLNAVNAKSAKGRIAYVNIKVKIDSVDILKNLMRKIRHLKGVIDVYRVNN